MRRPWRLTAAFALLLAAGSFLFSSYLFTRIQSERSRTIISNCRDVNARHDATIEKLDELVDATTGVQHARAVANRAGTVALLEAIVPYRDCERLARERVSAATP